MVQIEAAGKQRGDVTQILSFFIEEHKMIEGNARAATIAGCFVRANAYPCDLARDSGCLRLPAHTTQTNHGIEIRSPKPPHAVVNPKATTRIRVALVSALVDKRSHATSSCLAIVDPRVVCAQSLRA